MSAYFEEPRTCSSERSHYVFQTVSWGTKDYFEVTFGSVLLFIEEGFIKSDKAELIPVFPHKLSRIII